MPWFKAIAALLSTLTLAWVLTSIIGMHEERYFSAALVSAGIQVPSTLEEKKLAYAQALAERNPLMALPGTDLALFKSTIEELVELEEQAREVNASSSIAHLLPSLYPDQFLTSLHALESARRQFVLTGSRTDEAAYYAAARKAFAAYDKDARAFAKAFSQAVPKDSGKFATNGAIVSRADTLEAVEALREAVRDTSAAFWRRVGCVQRNPLVCDHGDLLAPAIIVTDDAPITPQELAQAKAVRTLSARAHEQPGIAQGPLLYLPTSTCAQDAGSGAPLFSFYRPASLEQKRSPFPAYVGDIRFNVSEVSAGSNFERFHDTITQEITYILDSMMLHYSCTTLAHDSGRLFAMQDTYAFAQDARLSSYATTSAEGAILAALETSNLEVLSQHAVEEYLAAAQALPLPQKFEESVRTLALSYLFSSAHFERNLEELLADEESNIALVKKGWPIALDIPYLFFARSSFSMLLLADNRSAVGNLPDLFPQNSIPKDKQPFVYYSQLPHTPATLSQIERDIRFFYKIHLDPSLIDGIPVR